MFKYYVGVQVFAKSLIVCLFFLLQLFIGLVQVCLHNMPPMFLVIYHVLSMIAGNVVQSTNATPHYIAALITRPINTPAQLTRQHRSGLEHAIRGHVPSIVEKEKCNVQMYILTFSQLVYLIIINWFSLCLREETLQFLHIHTYIHI